MFRSLVSAVITLLLAAPAFSQDKAAEIDRIFSWVTADSPGCTVAVAHGGKTVVSRAYGLADLERSVSLTPASIFDAGSLTKQFVAAAVLLLAEESRLSLSDDVRKHVPELPDYGHKVTIDHLLTHTSGIRDWTGILPLSEGDVDALTAVLRQRALNFPPGEEWSYSNSGYVLAKEIVARTSGMSFGEFVRRRLFEPLGMKSTSYRLDLRDVVRNRALAYEKKGDGWRLAMLLDNDRGGGGALLTTASDLLLWNEALSGARLGGFVTEKLHEEAKLNNGRTLRYGRGLFLDANRGGKVVWHTGSADGYKALLSRYPEQGLSIAILCNSGDGADRTMFARRIFDLFVPAGGSKSSDRDVASPSGVVVSEADLKARSGLFFPDRGGEPLRLIVQNSTLRIAGGPALVPVSGERFLRTGTSLDFMSQDEFELQFVSEDEFELKSMEGRTTRYRRAAPYEPTSSQLNAFAGTYESDEIGSVFQVVPSNDDLTMRFARFPERALVFRPVAPDTFQFARMLIRFRRDERGAISGFDYSNPLVRGVRFERLSAARTDR